MKMKNMLILLAVFAFLPALALADTPTFTPTLTPTITESMTVTPTITATFTITPTFTNSPTPQAVGMYAYPNPAAYRHTMGITYPVKTGKASALKNVEIKIYAANGDYAAHIIDGTPNGYTVFNIDKLARGTYIYKVIVRYLDGTEDNYPYKKFSIIK